MQKELDPEGARQHRRLTSRPKPAEVKATLHGRMATDLAEKQTVKILDFASSRLDNYRAEDEGRNHVETLRHFQRALGVSIASANASDIDADLSDYLAELAAVSTQRGGGDNGDGDDGGGGIGSGGSVRVGRRMMGAGGTFKQQRTRAINPAVAALGIGNGADFSFSEDSGFADAVRVTQIQGQDMIRCIEQAGVELSYAEQETILQQLGVGREGTIPVNSVVECLKPDPSKAGEGYTRPSSAERQGAEPATEDPQVPSAAARKPMPPTSLPPAVGHRRHG